MASPSSHQTLEPAASRVTIRVMHALNCRTAVAFLFAVVAVSCSEKHSPDTASGPLADSLQSDVTGTSSPNAGLTEQTSQTQGEEEDERQPREDEIAEDCVDFVRATKVIPAAARAADCPECPAEGTEALQFRSMQTDRVACDADRCQVEVTIHAVFNPGSGENIGGGLTAWIPTEQRTEFLAGRVPSGEQVYRVKIIYRRAQGSWRAIEFDRPDSR